MFVKLFALLAILSIGSACSASILTFEGLDDQTEIVSGYGGLNWTNMFALDAAAYDAFDPGTGYLGGLVSGKNIALNGFGDLAIASGDVFDFNSAYFAAVYDSGLEVTVEGYLSGAWVISSTVSLLAPTDVPGGGAKKFVFNFVGVDELRFSTNLGTQFAMDDFEINATPATVPEPRSLAVWTLAASFLCYVRCRTKSSRSDC